MITQAKAARCSSMIHPIDKAKAARWNDDALGRRVLAVQRRRTRTQGARCPATTHSAEGWIYQQDLSGGGTQKEKGRRVESFYDDHSSERCSLFQHDTPDRSGEGARWNDHALGRRVLAVQRRRTRAKGARCPATTHSAEGWIYQQDLSGGVKKRKRAAG